MSLFLGSSRSGQDKMTVSGLSGSGHLSILQAYRSFYMLEFPFPPLPCPKEPPNLTAPLRRVEHRVRVQREQVLQLRPRGRRVPRPRAVHQVGCDWWRPGHVTSLRTSDWSRCWAPRPWPSPSLPACTAPPPGWSPSSWRSQPSARSTATRSVNGTSRNFTVPEDGLLRQTFNLHSVLLESSL